MASESVANHSDKSARAANAADGLYGGSSNTSTSTSSSTSSNSSSGGSSGNSSTSVSDAKDTAISIMESVNLKDSSSSSGNSSGNSDSSGGSAGGSGGSSSGGYYDTDGNYVAPGSNGYGVLIAAPVIDSSVPVVSASDLTVDTSLGNNGYLGHVDLPNYSSSDSGSSVVLPATNSLPSYSLDTSDAKANLNTDLLLGDSNTISLERTNPVVSGLASIIGNIVTPISDALGLTTSYTNPTTGTKEVNITDKGIELGNGLADSWIGETAIDTANVMSDIIYGSDSEQSKLIDKVSDDIDKRKRSSDEDDDYSDSVTFSPRVNGSGRVVIGTKEIVAGNGKTYTIDLNAQGNPLAVIIAPEGSDLKTWDKSNVQVGMYAGDFVTPAIAVNADGTTTMSADDKVVHISNNEAVMERSDGSFYYVPLSHEVKQSSEYYSSMSEALDLTSQYASEQGNRGVATVYMMVDDDGNRIFTEVSQDGEVNIWSGDLTNAYQNGMRIVELKNNQDGTVSRVGYEEVTTTDSRGKEVTKRVASENGTLDFSDGDAGKYIMMNNSEINTGNRDYNFSSVGGNLNYVYDSETKTYKLLDDNGFTASQFTLTPDSASNDVTYFGDEYTVGNSGKVYRGNNLGTVLENIASHGYNFSISGDGKSTYAANSFLGEEVGRTFGGDTIVYSKTNPLVAGADMISKMFFPSISDVKEDYKVTNDGYLVIDGVVTNNKANDYILSDSEYESAVGSLKTNLAETYGVENPDDIEFSYNNNGDLEISKREYSTDENGNEISTLVWLDTKKSVRTTDDVKEKIQDSQAKISKMEDLRDRYLDGEISVQYVDGVPYFIPNKVQSYETVDISTINDFVPSFQIQDNLTDLSDFSKKEIEFIVNGKVNDDGSITSYSPTDVKGNDVYYHTAEIDSNGDIQIYTKSMTDIWSDVNFGTDEFYENQANIAKSNIENKSSELVTDMQNALSGDVSANQEFFKDLDSMIQSTVGLGVNFFQTEAKSVLESPVNAYEFLFYDTDGNFSPWLTSENYSNNYEKKSDIGVLDFVGNVVDMINDRSTMWDEYSGDYSGAGKLIDTIMTPLTITGIGGLAGKIGTKIATNTAKNAVKNTVKNSGKNVFKTHLDDVINGAKNVGSKITHPFQTTKSTLNKFSSHPFRSSFSVGKKALGTYAAISPVGATMNYLFNEEYAPNEFTQMGEIISAVGSQRGMFGGLLLGGVSMLPTVIGMMKDTPQGISSWLNYDYSQPTVDVRGNEVQYNNIGEGLLGSVSNTFTSFVDFVGEGMQDNPWVTIGGLVVPAVAGKVLFSGKKGKASSESEYSRQNVDYNRGIGTESYHPSSATKSSKDLAKTRDKLLKEIDKKRARGEDTLVEEQEVARLDRRIENRDSSIDGTAVNSETLLDKLKNSIGNVTDSIRDRFHRLDSIKMEEGRNAVESPITDVTTYGDTTSSLVFGDTLTSTPMLTSSSPISIFTRTADLTSTPRSTVSGVVEHMPHNESVYYDSITINPYETKNGSIVTSDSLINSMEKQQVFYEEKAIVDKLKQKKNPTKAEKARIKRFEDSLEDTPQGMASRSDIYRQHYLENGEREFILHPDTTNYTVTEVYPKGMTKSEYEASHPVNSIGMPNSEFTISEGGVRYNPNEHIPVDALYDKQTGNWYMASGNDAKFGDWYYQDKKTGVWKKNGKDIPTAKAIYTLDELANVRKGVNYHDKGLIPYQKQEGYVFDNPYFYDKHRSTPNTSVRDSIVGKYIYNPKTKAIKPLEEKDLLESGFTKREIVDMFSEEHPDFKILSESGKTPLEILRMEKETGETILPSISYRDAIKELTEIERRDEDWAKRSTRFSERDEYPTYYDLKDRYPLYDEADILSLLDNEMQMPPSALREAKKIIEKRKNDQEEWNRRSKGFSERDDYPTYYELRDKYPLYDEADILSLLDNELQMPPSALKEAKKIIEKRKRNQEEWNKQSKVSWERDDYPAYYELKDKYPLYDEADILSLLNNELQMPPSALKEAKQIIADRKKMEQSYEESKRFSKDAEKTDYPTYYDLKSKYPLYDEADILSLLDNELQMPPSALKEAKRIIADRNTKDQLYNESKHFSERDDYPTYYDLKDRYPLYDEADILSLLDNELQMPPSALREAKQIIKNREKSNEHVSSKDTNLTFESQYSSKIDREANNLNDVQNLNDNIFGNMNVSDYPVVDNIYQYMRTHRLGEVNSPETVTSVSTLVRGEETTPYIRRDNVIDVISSQPNTFIIKDNIGDITRYNLINHGERVGVNYEYANLLPSSTESSNLALSTDVRSVPMRYRVYNDIVDVRNITNSIDSNMVLIDNVKPQSAKVDKGINNEKASNDGKSHNNSKKSQNKEWEEYCKEKYPEYWKLKYDNKIYEKRYNNGNKLTDLQIAEKIGIEKLPQQLQEQVSSSYWRFKRVKAESNKRRELYNREHYKDFMALIDKGWDLERIGSSLNKDKIPPEVLVEIEKIKEYKKAEREEALFRERNKSNKTLNDLRVERVIKDLERRGEPIPSVIDTNVLGSEDFTHVNAPDYIVKGMNSSDYGVAKNILQYIKTHQLGEINAPEMVTNVSTLVRGKKTSPYLRSDNVIDVISSHPSNFIIKDSIGNINRYNVINGNESVGVNYAYTNLLPAQKSVSDISLSTDIRNEPIKLRVYDDIRDVQYAHPKPIGTIDVSVSTKNETTSNASISGGMSSGGFGGSYYDGSIGNVGNVSIPTPSTSQKSSGRGGQSGMIMMEKPIETVDLSGFGLINPTLDLRNVGYVNGVKVDIGNILNNTNATTAVSTAVPRSVGTFNSNIFEAPLSVVSPQKTTVSFPKTENGSNGKNSNKSLQEFQPLMESASLGNKREENNTQDNYERIYELGGKVENNNTDNSNSIFGFGGVIGGVQQGINNVGEIHIPRIDDLTFDSGTNPNNNGLNLPSGDFISEVGNGVIIGFGEDFDDGQTETQIPSHIIEPTVDVSPILDNPTIYDEIPTETIIHYPAETVIEDVKPKESEKEKEKLNEKLRQKTKNRKLFKKKTDDEDDDKKAIHKRKIKASRIFHTELWTPSEVMGLGHDTPEGLKQEYKYGGNLEEYYELGKGKKKQYKKNTLVHPVIPEEKYRPFKDVKPFDIRDLGELSNYIGKTDDEINDIIAKDEKQFEKQRKLSDKLKQHENLDLMRQEKKYAEKMKKSQIKEAEYQNKIKNAGRMSGHKVSVPSIDSTFREINPNNINKVKKSRKLNAQSSYENNYNMFSIEQPKNRKSQIRYTSKNQSSFEFGMINQPSKPQRRQSRKEINQPTFGFDTFNQPQRMKNSNKQDNFGFDGFGFEEFKQPQQRKSRKQDDFGFGGFGFDNTPKRKSSKSKKSDGMFDVSRMF